MPKPVAPAPHFSISGARLAASLAVLVLLGAMLALAAACGGENEEADISFSPAARARGVPLADLPPSPPPVGEPPEADKVVLVVIDALRADALGCYGYPRPVSPSIDRLAAESAVFDTFHASAPWTLPSFASILTGVSPQVSKVRVSGGEDLRKLPGKKKGRRITVIHRQLPTLAELLPGVSTYAIVNNNFLHEQHGFGRGFGTYDFERAGFASYRQADETVKRALDWLGKNRQGPLFALIHLFDPHVPYYPPEKYRRRFGLGEKGRMRPRDYYQFRKIRDEKLVPTFAEKSYLRGLYDGEVRFSDDSVGELVEGMRRIGLLDSAWLVITADHGEEFWEHGGFEHGHRYEEELTRVPLLIRAPGGRWGAGRRVALSARHVDIAPTVLEWLDVERPAHLEGRSLLPMISGEEDGHRPAYMEHKLRGKLEVAWFDGRYKLIWWSGEHRDRLYDLLEDPGERRSLGEDHPMYRPLRKALIGYRRSLDAAGEALGEDEAPEVEIDEDLKEAMEKLGYFDE
jgi:arylsulfatase A-like enzyme